MHEDVLGEFCQHLSGSNPNSFTPVAHSDESYEILTHHLKCLVAFAVSFDKSLLLKFWFVTVNLSNV